MSQIAIVKNGSIQGWFVSFTITMVTLAAFVAAMLSDKYCARFAQIGSTWATIAVGQFTAWLAYRAYTSSKEAKKEG